MASLKTYLWKTQWDKTKDREKEHTYATCSFDDHVEKEMAWIVVSVS